MASPALPGGLILSACQCHRAAITFVNGVACGSRDGPRAASPHGTGSPRHRLPLAALTPTHQLLGARRYVDCFKDSVGRAADPPPLGLNPAMPHFVRLSSSKVNF